jgi:hypothetical protein
MAAEAELVSIRHAQIVAGGATVRIVAVCTTHLSFSKRMVVRQTHLAAFGLVAPQASIICLPARLHHHFGFRNQVLHVGHAARCHHIRGHKEIGFGFGISLCLIAVSLMAIYAANFVGSMRPCHPVANFLISRVTTQADAITFRGGTMAKGDDLGNVAAALHVQAAGTVALLAFHALLGMKRMPKILSDVGMTCSACVGSHRGRPWNLHVLRIRGDRVFGFLGSYGWKAENHNESKNDKGEDFGIRPH